MKLLREKITDFKPVRESLDNKRWYIEGIFLQGEIVNGNRRKYSIEALDSAVQTYLPMIQSNRAIGELNHPDSPDLNFERACIKTISLEKDGNNYIGKALVLSTPLGNLVSNLLDDEVQIAVSSRGLADIQEVNGIELIANEYYICAAADVVHSPSAPDAFVSSLMEGKSWMFDGTYWRPEVIESAKKKVAKAPSSRLKEEMIKVVKELFDSIKV